MKQKQFTDYVIPKIIDRFPELKNCVVLKSDEIINIDYKSPLGKLTLWLTTQDNEITIGFADDTKFGWHTHMNMFGAVNPDEEIDEAIELISNILTDQYKIIHSTVLGYFIGGDTDGENKYKQEDEITESFYWSEL